MTKIFERLFIYIILGAALVGYFFPGPSAQIVPHIKLLLGIVMFSMGLGLSLEDFKLVISRPKPVIVGVLAQFIIMPLIAFILAKAFSLPAEMAVGMVLVGACPGGTASNVMVYLSRGDLALSVTMTSISTMLAPFITPAIIYLLASTWLEIDALALFLTVIQVILFPIALAIIFKSLFRDFAYKLSSITSIFAMLSVAMIVTAVVAINAGKIAGNLSGALDLNLVLIIALAVVLHNGMGLLLGYTFAKLLGLEEAQRRAVSIEVGMQNSGLGAVLAVAHFGPLAALPSAIFSFWHNVSGALLASRWSRD